MIIIENLKFIIILTNFNEAINCLLPLKGTSYTIEINLVQINQMKKKNNEAFYPYSILVYDLNQNQKKLWIKGRRRSCWFLRILTYTDEGLF